MAKKKTMKRKPPVFKLTLTAAGAKRLARELGVSERAVRRRTNPFSRAKVEKRGNRLVLVFK